MNKKDIEDATEAAIERYEARRQAQKAKKKKEQAKEQHDAKVFKDINNAISRNNNDGWGICFQ
jgi:ribosomal protein L9